MGEFLNEIQFMSTSVFANFLLVRFCASFKFIATADDNKNHWRNYGGNAAKFLNEDGGVEREAINAPAKVHHYSLEYIVENRDMSVENSFLEYYPLDETYDYCSKCNNEFPTRIRYSERAYQETIQDQYKDFLANNYRDLLYP